MPLAEWEARACNGLGSLRESGVMAWVFLLQVACPQRFPNNMNYKKSLVTWICLILIHNIDMIHKCMMISFYIILLIAFYILLYPIMAIILTHDENPLFGNYWIS